MEEQCLICRQSYDITYYPMLSICPSHHTSCRACKVKKYGMAQTEICPFCRSIVNQTKLFLPYIKCQQQLIKKKIQNRHNLQQMIKNESILTIKELLFFKSQQNPRIFRPFLRQKAIQFMKNEDYFNAIHLFMVMIQIEDQINLDQKFVGLGSMLQAQGYYEIKRYEWFQQKFGDKLSSFDLLSLCLMKFNVYYEEQQDWFKMRQEENPLNYKLIYSFAVFEMNFHHFAQALVLIETVIKIDNTFSKSFLMKAYIFGQMKKKELMHKYANQTLKRDPYDISAHYLCALLSPQKIKMIQQMYQILKVQPIFVKALLIIGKKQKKKQQSFTIFKKCIETNQQYIQGLIKFGQTKLKLIDFNHSDESDENLQCRKIFTSLIANKKLSKEQLAVCYENVAYSFYVSSEYEAALQYYYKIIQIFPEFNLRLSIPLIQCYYCLRQHIKVVQKGKELIDYFNNHHKEQFYQYRRSISAQRLYEITIFSLIDLKQQEAAINLLVQWQAFNPQKAQQKKLKFLRYCNPKLYTYPHQDDQLDAVRQYEICLKKEIQPQKNCIKLVEFLYSKQKYFSAKGILIQHMKRPGISLQYREIFINFKSQLEKKTTLWFVRTF